MKQPNSFSDEDMVAPGGKSLFDIDQQEAGRILELVYTNNVTVTPMERTKLHSFLSNLLEKGQELFENRSVSDAIQKVSTLSQA